MYNEFLFVRTEEEGEDLMIRISEIITIQEKRTGRGRSEITLQNGKTFVLRTRFEDIKDDLKMKGG